MSVSSKKQKRHEAWEESLGGSFPEIMVDDQGEEPWLMWVYHVAPFEVRVEIPLVAVDYFPWLYIDGNDQCLSDSALQSSSETYYRAMTRVQLMDENRLAIAFNRKTGLAELEKAATRAGLFGKREPRCCVIPQWTTT
ncbi:MAG: hypothetical protein L0H94_06840 [Nitrospira sp.]|nr:hypothetical protein [Nitrospira sp.]